MPTMRVREGELQNLASAIVSGLHKQGYVHFKKDEAIARARIIEVIARTIEEEQALEEEAERLAESQSRKLAGMDYRRIIQGIKERLARDRNFPL